MSAGFQVHLAPEAADVLREASRAAAAAVATALDDIALRGPAGLDVDWNGPAWIASVAAGDLVVTVAGREGDARIVVVQIAFAEAPAEQRAVDILPLSVARRRVLAEALQGLNLDLRYTWRALRRTPVFAAVVVATLALGFGGGAALLDIVHTVYAGALPFGDGDRLVRVRNSNTSPAGTVRRYNLTPSDFHILREQNRSFADVVAMGGRSLSLIGDGPAERVSAISVSPNWVRTLRLAPVIGRAFTPDEERAGSDAIVGLISHGLWQRRFGGDSSVVGSLLRHDGGVITVVGVMPPGINYPYDADVWTPGTFLASNTTVGSLNVVARLAEGATLSSARADADRMHADREAANLHRSATGFDVATVRTDFIRDDARTVQALSAAVLFLLVLACVNVANLLVARFTTRRAELGVRAALGGRRDQQLRQMLLESLVLFAAGTMGSVLVATWLRQSLSLIVPDDLRTQLGFPEAGVGVGIVAVTAVIGMASGLAVGLIAALRAIRADPMTLVKAGGRGSVGSGDRRLFDVLVAAQLSLSLVLLAGASLLIGRFRELSSAHPGFELAGVATMRVTVDQQDRYRRADARAQLARELEERLATVPGVEAVGITSVNPLCCGDWGAPIEIEGRPLLPDEPATLVVHTYVTPGYFTAMRIPLLRGTGFDRSDRLDGLKTVVVDEAFARMAWPGEDPLGKRVRSARSNQPWRTVVGVVPVTDRESELTAGWYLPYLQDPLGASGEHMHMMVRRSPSVTMESLREVVREIDPALAVYGTTTMELLQRDRTAQDQLGAIVSGVFAAFGLLLAGFSLYGLLSYSVELRTRELAVRQALGATRSSIVALIVRQAAARLAIGSALGLVLALALNQVLRSAISGLPWISPFAALWLSGLLAIVTGIAAVAPALRATRVDPIRSLRG